MRIRKALILNIISRPLNKYGLINITGRWKENKCLAGMVMQCSKCGLEGRLTRM